MALVLPKLLINLVPVGLVTRDGGKKILFVVPVLCGAHKIKKIDKYVLQLGSSM